MMKMSFYKVQPPHQCAIFEKEGLAALKDIQTNDSEGEGNFPGCPTPSWIFSISIPFTLCCENLSLLVEGMLNEQDSVFSTRSLFVSLWSTDSYLPSILWNSAIHSSATWSSLIDRYLGSYTGDSLSLCLPSKAGRLLTCSLWTTPWSWTGGNKPARFSGSIITVFVNSQLGWQPFQPLEDYMKSSMLKGLIKINIMIK